MKYKCIKDFWMEDTSREDGFKPAFAKGEVYDFRRKGEDFVTDKDHCGHVHYMPTEDINNYFELVEDKQMSDMKWEEGKTYKFKVDSIEKFKATNYSNAMIADVIGLNFFTVKRLGQHGAVVDLVEFPISKTELAYWFRVDEIHFFDVVDTSIKTTTNEVPDSDIVVEFLDKLTYVSANDYTVTDMLYLNKDGAVLTTDFADFRGGKQIYEFVTQRYDLLQQEAKHKKNNELMERKAKLEAELAEVNKELGNV